VGTVRVRIPEIVVEDRRLGRNLNHDPRSRQYRTGWAGKPVTAKHERRIPYLNQNSIPRLHGRGLGCCSGCATVGLLGSEPFFSTLDEDHEEGLDINLAVDVYSLATQIDPFAGVYPNSDTGSDGLSVAKAAVQLDYSSGYQHIMSLDEAYAQIVEGPFIFGGIWMSSMDEPDSEGVVRFSGYARGGHEWLFREYDATTGLWLADNSWTEDWGLGGSFKVPDEDMQKQFEQQADATVIIPLTEPAPTPQPEPEEHPFPWKDVDPWRHAPHVWSKTTKAVNAINKWAISIGHE
jgi:hypothetical protein